MNLSEYFRVGVRSRADLAACVGVSPSYLYQMEKGLRPVSAIRALAIERATEGAVARPDLRPDDWRDIWPELAEHEAAGARAETVAVVGKPVTADEVLEVSHG